MDLSIEFKKENGKLSYSTFKDEALYKAFRDDVPEGAKVEAYFDVNLQDGSLAQLAKVHKLIREIAHHTGHSFGDIKFEVKLDAGLYVERRRGNERYLSEKSFAKCNKEELSLAIQAAMELAQTHNVPEQFIL
jgi:hypothetical protein